VTEAQEIMRIMLGLSEHSPSGFAVALHARFTAADYVHQTYSRTWSAIYSQNGYVMQDPTVSFGFQHLGCIRWSALAAQDTMKIYEQARAYGLNYGFACAVEFNGSRSIAGFSRDDREYDDAEMAAMEGDLADLHRLTAIPGVLSPALREELRQLAVRFTKP
jgi:LuxR family transcriptional regulator, quorum-sensing system regulator SdiA